MLNIRKNYYTNGNIYSETYTLNGRRHNDNGPAIIYYHSNGKISRVYYYLNNELHREDGPAVIWYYLSGVVEEELYFLNGIEITDDLKIMVIKGLSKM